MPDFPADDLAAVLHPQELEVLEELSWEFDDLDLDLSPVFRALAKSPPVHRSGDSSIASYLNLHRPSGRAKISKMLLDANRANRAAKPYPKVVHIAQNADSSKVVEIPPDEEYEAPLSPVDRERYEEVKEELKELGRSGRRLPAVQIQSFKELMTAFISRYPLASHSRRISSKRRSKSFSRLLRVYTSVSFTT